MFGLRYVMPYAFNTSTKKQRQGISKFMSRKTAENRTREMVCARWLSVYWQCFYITHRKHEIAGIYTFLLEY